MSTLNNYKNDKTAPSNREHPVLILGAGLNGLVAAYELRKLGQKPVIWMTPIKLRQRGETGTLS